MKVTRTPSIQPMIIVATLFIFYVQAYYHGTRDRNDSTFSSSSTSNSLRPSTIPIEFSTKIEFIACNLPKK